jgi:small subunit ribosomal protein S6
MFLIDANEASKGWSDLESHIMGLLGKNHARLEYSERWPDQRLGTEINGVKKGTYFLTYFRAPTDRIAHLRRDVELSDRILRFLVIQEDFLDEEMSRRRDHSRRRAEQPAAPVRAESAEHRAAGDEPRSRRPAADDAEPEGLEDEFEAE